MKKINSWENELWHYVSNGQDMSCPLYIQCSRRDDIACTCPIFGDTSNRNRCSGCAQFHQDDLIKQYGLCQKSNIPFIEVIRPGRINELIQKLADSWLIKEKIKQAPVPSRLIKQIDTDAGIEIHTIPLKACNGALWKTNNKWIIYLNSKDDPSEQRLTLFHEGFHILARLHSNPVFRKPGESGGFFNEVLADKFAHQILMPQRWIEDSWIQVKDTRTLADRFQVTEKAIISRLRSLSLPRALTIMFVPLFSLTAVLKALIITTNNMC